MAGGISQRSLTQRILVGVAMTTVSCAIALWAYPAIGIIASTLSLVICVLLVGASQGLVPGLIAATGAFLFFNVFMADPILTLRLTHREDVAPLIAFNLTALIAGVLAGKLRDRASAAERATAWSALLVEAGNEVQSLISSKEIDDRLRDLAFRHFRLEVSFELPNAAGQLDDVSTIDVREAWAKRSPSKSEATISLPMEGVTGPMGVMRAVGDWRKFEDFLPSFASLAAVALERSILSERVGEVRALERSEEIKSALLSSVSHDFRTPLAAISASASSLVEFEKQISADQRDLFLATILSECTRLDNYASNLLELSKLEGDQTLRTQILSINDVVGAVLSLPFVRNADRRISVGIPPDLLVEANTTLFELTLLNIVGNAINFSAAGSEIEIDAWRDAGNAVLRIRDEGPGVPPAELERIFDKFYRGQGGKGRSSGSGLGLAIAKGFVIASGGSISASIPGLNGRGMSISLQLPAVRADRPNA